MVALSSKNFQDFPADNAKKVKFHIPRRLPNHEPFHSEAQHLYGVDLQAASLYIKENDEAHLSNTNP